MPPDTPTALGAASLTPPSLNPGSAPGTPWHYKAWHVQPPTNRHKRRGRSHRWRCGGLLSDKSSYVECLESLVTRPSVVSSAEGTRSVHGLELWSPVSRVSSVDNLKVGGGRQPCRHFPRGNWTTQQYAHAQ